MPRDMEHLNGLFLVLVVIACGLEVVIDITYISDISLSRNIFYIKYGILIFLKLWFINRPMTTNKPRVLLTIGKDLLEKIEDFRFDNRISSRSKAIRRLLEEALKRYEKKTNRKKSND